MSKGSNENLGFLSRMSELELRLKQSEDERLALEEKFNQLLSARKSEEEMHLYMLRENYSQLLRQDKMRCDRNDMILQALANVESRASMLTAKTDRLRLLRQHYESYVSRHYPVLKKAVSRYRSVESLISDTNEDTSQRSVSSSPRLTTSYSPSPFLRSPSITRRNSLVVSNSEILDPISYKVPNRINLTSHFSRRRLFEDTPKQDKSPDSKTIPKNFLYPRNDKKENLFKNNIPTFIVSNTEKPNEEPTSDGEKNTSGLFLDIQSFSDYPEKGFLKDSGEFSKRESEKTFVRINHPIRSNISGKYEKLSPTRGSDRIFSTKPTPTKPLTKSSSFSIGSSFSRNVSYYLSPERRRAFIRRPSFVHQTAVSPLPLNRFQPPVTYDFSCSERPSFYEQYSFSERSKSPLSERAKSPLSRRDMSPTVIKSKSPLTVVDDIFKKYLINYDRRYLSDPISESKYGKYLYPLSHYDYTYREDQKINKFSNLLETKYDGRTPCFDDDISISSRESVGTNLYKTYESQDSLLTNDRQPLFPERNMSYFNDKKDWKEWNHYRNRYEYPPTLGSERPQTKSTFMTDIYYPSTHENICEEVTKSTSYNFPDDLPPKYSYPLNMYGESYECNLSETDLKNPVRSKESLISYERKISGKQNLTSKDTFRIPQTPKKVSFSNEFLYDDKSDAEVSSSIDEVTIPFDHIKSSKVTTEHIEASSSEKNSYQGPDQDIINLSSEIKPYESRHFDGKLGLEDTKKPLTDGILKANGEVSLTKYNEKENSLYTDIKEFKCSNESGDSEKDSNSLENKNSNIKYLEPTGENQEEKITESLEDKDLPNTESNIEHHLKEMPLKVTISNESYSLDDEKEEDIRGNNKGQVSVSSIEDNEREDIIKKGDYINEKSSTEPNDSLSVESKTTEFIASSQDFNVGLDTQNETFPVEEEEMQSAMQLQNNINQDNQNVHTEKHVTSNSFADQDSTSLKYGSTENLQSQKPAGIDTYDTPEVGYNEEQQRVYDQGPHEQKGIHNDLTSQQYHDPNIYKNSDISDPPDYNREQFDQPQHQYDQYGPQKEGYVSEEYVQNDSPGYDSTQDVYGPETYGTKNYQQPEVYSGDQYEQQHLEYDGKDFRGSQQNIQDYPKPLPQQQYEDERYINQDQYEQYKDSDQHYPPENMPEGYVAEQPYEGEYPPEYSQQQYDPNYQDPSQVSQNETEQYKADYNTVYQDDSQYGYDQVGNTYDEQYEQHGLQYDHQQQPPYDQYEQQPAEPVYDQYEQQPHEPPYDQYEQKPADPPFDQYEQQPPEPQTQYDQYKKQPAEHYDDQYQGAPDQYGNYTYAYDQTAPVAEQAYIGDDQQNYVEETQPYDYNEPLQQPYDDVVQHQPYSENVPYEGTQPIYPDEQNVYGDEQQVYEPSVYVSQNLNVSQHEKLPSDYDFTQSPQPNDSQLLTQQGEPLNETEAKPYTQADLSSREASEPTPKLNQILESDPDSSVAQGPVTHEDSSDFDFSAGQK